MISNNTVFIGKVQHTKNYKRAPLFLNKLFLKELKINCGNNMKSVVLIMIVLLIYSCDSTDPTPGENLDIAGPLLFISNESGTMQLYSMKLDGTDVKQITNNPNFPVTDAKWSPDGKMIALTSPSTTKNKYGADIYIMDADGTNKYKLTGNALQGVHYGSGEQPNWSHDSKSLVFSRLMFPEAIGNTDLYVIDINSENEKRVTSTYSLSEMWPSFSCDNNKILAMVIHWNTVDSTGNSIQHFTTNIIDLNGNTINEFGVEGEGWNVPIWSYDCSKILFTFSDSSYDNHIYYMNADGTELQRLLINEFKFYQCVEWTNDNLIIYNATNQNYFNNIFMMNIDLNILQDITPFDVEIVEATSLKLN